MEYKGILKFERMQRDAILQQVAVKVAPLPHHIAGLSFTATGYGSRIPTQYMVKFCGRWRRVYCRVYSNIGTLYILDKAAPNGRTIVDIEQAGE